MSVYDTRQRTRGSTWLAAALISIGFTALLWVIELIDQASGQRLDAEGIIPRNPEGLSGVLVAPLLHAGWAHLEANTVPTLVLLFLVLATGIGRGVLATLIIWAVAGLGVWLLAPAYTVHIGDSSLIFGWLVFLILRGFFARSAAQITLGILLFLVYGGLLWGVLPGQPGISWQGHLFGAVGGGLAAFWMGDRTQLARRGFSARG